MATASTMSETSWSLRSMTADDVPIVAALHAASWRRAYRGILGDDYLDGGSGDDLQAVELSLALCQALLCSKPAAQRLLLRQGHVYSHSCT